MAIFSVSVKAHSRSKNESATGGAAYRLGLDLTNEATGERHNYAARKDITAAFTLLPKNAPAGWENPAVLWREADRAEKRKNSTVSREVLVALPAEMTDKQREELARSIAADLVRRYGVGLSVGIHKPDDGGRNYHAHILLTTRRIGPDGLGEKTRELDDQKQGPGQVVAIREGVAERTNEHLQRHGYTARIDHRNLEDQRQAALDKGHPKAAANLSRAATKHRGRNREVAQRVSVENQNTQQANQQSQAEAHAVFAAMAANAARQARLMAPAFDTGKSKAAMEQELHRATVALRCARAEKQAAAASAAAHRSRAKRRESFRTKWEKAHPVRAWLGLRPKAVRKAEAEAKQARQLAQEAQELATSHAAACALEREKREAAKARIERNQPEAKQARQRAQERIEAPRRRQMAPRPPAAPQAPQRPTQTPQTRRGPRMR